MPGDPICNGRAHFRAGGSPVRNFSDNLLEQVWILQASDLSAAAPDRRRGSPVPPGRGGVQCRATLSVMVLHISVQAGRPYPIPAVIPLSRSCTQRHGEGWAMYSSAGVRFPRGEVPNQSPKILPLFAKIWVYLTGYHLRQADLSGTACEIFGQAQRAHHLSRPAWP